MKLSFRLGKRIAIFNFFKMTEDKSNVLPKIKLHLCQRHSGSTTKMLYRANKTKGIIIVPYASRMDHIKMQARLLHLKDVNVVCYRPDLSNLRGLNRPLYFDNFEEILAQLINSALGSMLLNVEEINIDKDMIESSFSIDVLKNN